MWVCDKEIKSLQGCGLFRESVFDDKGVAVWCRVVQCVAV